MVRGQQMTDRGNIFRGRRPQLFQPGDHPLAQYLVLYFARLQQRDSGGRSLFTPLGECFSGGTLTFKIVAIELFDHGSQINHPADPLQRFPPSTA